MISRENFNAIICKALGTIIWITTNFSMAARGVLVFSGLEDIGRGQLFSRVGAPMMRGSVVRIGTRNKQYYFSLIAQLCEKHGFVFIAGFEDE